jgi:hypothetical protein
MRMEQWLLNIVGALTAGVILLFLEHRTGFFAHHIPKVFGLQREPPKERDWAETIYRVKQGLGKIYGVAPDSITVGKWEPKDRNKRIRLEATLSPESSGMRWSNDYYIVWAERDGRILHSRHSSEPRVGAAYR